MCQILMNGANSLTAEDLINGLGLEKHIEGGYFKRTYASETAIDTKVGRRLLATSILYLLTKDSPIGHFHQNTSNILHFYHGGDPIT